MILGVTFDGFYFPARNTMDPRLIQHEQHGEIIEWCFECNVVSPKQKLPPVDAVTRLSVKAVMDGRIVRVSYVAFCSEVSRHEYQTSEGYQGFAFFRCCILGRVA